MIDTIAFVLTGIGLAASIVYYANILNNANKTRELQLKAQELTVETRQAQLYMEIWREFRNKDFQKDYLTAMNVEIEDVDDFVSNWYNIDNLDYRLTIYSYGYYLEGIGVLVQRGIIDLHMVDNLIGGNTRRYWKLWKPAITKIQETDPSFFEWGTYLCESLEKIEPTRAPIT